MYCLLPAQRSPGGGDGAVDVVRDDVLRVDFEENEAVSGAREGEKRVSQHPTGTNEGNGTMRQETKKYEIYWGEILGRRTV